MLEVRRMDLSGNFQIRPMMTTKDRIARLFKERSETALPIDFLVSKIYRQGGLVSL